MDTNIGIYTTIKKAMREHGLQILNTDADVREHRFIGTGQFALNEGQKICKHFLVTSVARLVNPFIGNGFHMVCNRPISTKSMPKR